MKNSEHTPGQIHDELIAPPEPEFIAVPLDEHFELLDEPEPDRSTVPAGIQLLIALSLLAGLFGSTYVPGIREYFVHEPPSPVEQVIRARDTSAEASITPLPEPKLEAVSAFVWDVKEQKALYNHNAGEQLPLASLTKLMTALVAMESLGDDARIAMTLEAIAQDGPSDFMDGEFFKAKDMAAFMLVTSSNDGAYALAAAAGGALSGVGSSAPGTFIDAMNVRAEELGLSQTYFTNPTGLDNSPVESGGYGSARDVAFLMEFLLSNRPEIIEPSVESQATVAGTTLHTARNTNAILARIPGLIGTKTGYTDLAGGNLVVAFNAGLDHPIVVSVLGSSREGRFDDVLALVKYAQSHVAAATSN